MIIFLLYSAVYIETHARLLFSSPVPSIGRAEGLLPFSALRSLRPWSDRSQIRGARSVLKSALCRSRLRALPTLAQSFSPTLFDSILFPSGTYALFLPREPLNSFVFKRFRALFMLREGVRPRAAVLA